MNSKNINFLATIIFCTIITTNSQNKPPPDSYILACGSTTDATDTNDRKWISDTNFLKQPNTSLSATAQSQDPSLPSTIPYMTARVFKSSATYTFSISRNIRHWIRLHFYPSTYNDLDSSNSYFSVMAGGYTLLDNFSVSITAQALTQAYIIREFSIRGLESDTLSLTITPSSSYKDSFAFINGIEIVSMPEIFQDVPMVGFSDVNMDMGLYTMQTMFRLNVGGNFIPANEDSGLSRIWYDDSPYIFGAAFGVTSQADSNVTIVYPSKESELIAPVEVYSTARSMGPTPKLNENYNLTWIFDVDVNFSYLVRLHFCEFHLDKVNQMVFSIFINNQTAEEEADVIGWSGRKGVPVYKDYVVYLNDRNGGDDHLWVALHPNVESKPEFYDSILNGIEIFKLNDTKLNLAGPNPVPVIVQDEPMQGRPPSKSSNRRIIIGSVLGSFAGCLLLGIVIAFIVRRKKRDEAELSSTIGWLPVYSSTRSSTTRTSSKSSRSSTLSSLGGGGLCRHFSLQEIRLGTNDFSESRVIGVGGFGKVYEGFIDGSTTTKVAVKRANPCSEQGVHEFLNEIELLSKLRHRHLVSLIGACEENDEMILVYDYMENGTLREHLYKTDNPPLSWDLRLRICIGAARGIHYLHTGAKYTIIHRDVKSTNILLDKKWVAKVSDFGLSKTGHTVNQTHVSTVVKGSFGYLDPEYFRRQQLTEKSDVYSFGVVLFEVLCGRPALNPSLPKEQVSLADWAVTNHRTSTLDGIIDPYIKWEINPECLKHFAETGVKCLSDHGLDRPSMGTVLWNLEYCLQLQKNPNRPKVEAEQKANDAYAMYSTLVRIDEGDQDEMCDQKLEDHSAITIFSEGMHQEGR